MSLSLSFMAFADEGMWAIDNFPADAVADRYGVDIGDDWLREARLATTEITGGKSGSPIIAADGTWPASPSTETSIRLRATTGLIRA